MAFVTIDPNEIEVGDPVTKDLFDKIKDNLDDLDSRTQNIESSVSKIVVFDVIVSNRAQGASLTGLTDFRAITPFVLTNAEVEIYEKGSLTGTLEIDVKKSITDLDNASLSTVFTTRPSIDYSTASDFEKSTNQVFDAGQINIAIGNYLRLDVTELPVNGNIGRYRVLVYGEPS